MNISFIINFKLNSPSSDENRTAILGIPDLTAQIFDKESFLLFCCGKISKCYNECLFYKRVQVMAPFLERPIRIKYMISLPNGKAILLDASINELSLKSKLKKNKDCFDIAKTYNKTKLKIIESVVLINEAVDSLSQLQQEYDIKIMTINQLLNFIQKVI